MRYLVTVGEHHEYLVTAKDREEAIYLVLDYRYDETPKPTVTHVTSETDSIDVAEEAQ